MKGPVQTTGSPCFLHALAFSVQAASLSSLSYVGKHSILILEINKEGEVLETKTEKR
jgi:hypothetical protein